MFNFKSLIIVLFTIFFIGCKNSIPTPQERANTINALIPATFQKKLIETSSYRFYSVENIQKECTNINVYFEGDGLAWLSRSTISDNPTPINPIGFKLMIKDKTDCSIYIARACQYVEDSKCTKKDWASHRFSQNIIDATNEAIEIIKQQYNNKTFRMLGFSGGGAIATLISAKRDDVIQLTTFAGNLDTQKLAQIHNITPLNGSLNPADFTKKLEKIKQVHFVGAKDTIIPNEIIKSFMNRLSDKSNITIKSCDRCTHGDGWIEFWDEKQ